MGFSPLLTLGSVQVLYNRCPVFTGTLTTNAITLNGTSLQTTLNGKQPIPHVSLKVLNTGALAFSNGLTTTANISISRTYTGACVITFTPAHPSGVNYSALTTAHTDTSSIIATVFVNSSTQFTVYTRNTVTGNLTDCDFFAKTVP